MFAKRDCTWSYFSEFFSTFNREIFSYNLLTPMLLLFYLRSKAFDDFIVSDFRISSSLFGSFSDLLGDFSNCIRSSLTMASVPLFSCTIRLKIVYDFYFGKRYITLITSLLIVRIGFPSTNSCFSDSIAANSQGRLNKDKGSIFLGSHIIF